MIKVMSVIGTRPEAIKMAPVIQELNQYPDSFHSMFARRLNTGRCDQVRDFDIAVDDDLTSCSRGPSQVTARIPPYLTK
jgi:UDP-N-acetylglucosamine 2-epimerase (non-hydrolysing)